jgi:hypothetical protein
MNPAILDNTVGGTHNSETRQAIEDLVSDETHPFQIPDCTAYVFPPCRYNSSQLLSLIPFFSSSLSSSGFFSPMLLLSVG